MLQFLVAFAVAALAFGGVFVGSVVRALSAGGPWQHAERFTEA